MSSEKRVGISSANPCHGEIRNHKSMAGQRNYLHKGKCVLEEDATTIVLSQKGSNAACFKLPRKATILRRTLPCALARSLAHLLCEGEVDEHLFEVAGVIDLAPQNTLDNLPSLRRSGRK